MQSFPWSMLSRGSLKINFGVPWRAQNQTFCACFAKFHFWSKSVSGDQLIMVKRKKGMSDVLQPTTYLWPWESYFSPRWVRGIWALWSQRPKIICLFPLLQFASGKTLLPWSSKSQSLTSISTRVVHWICEGYPEHLFRPNTIFYRFTYVMNDQSDISAFAWFLVFNNFKF